MNWLLIRISVFKMAVSWLGQLVGNLSPWRPGFNPRLVLARSLVDKVALGQIFFRVICFPSLYHSSNALYWSSSCRFCYQEDKRAKRGNLQIKHWSFGNMSTVNKSTFFQSSNTYRFLHKSPWMLSHSSWLTQLHSSWPVTVDISE